MTIAILIISIVTLLLVLFGLCGLVIETQEIKDHISEFSNDVLNCMLNMDRIKDRAKEMAAKGETSFDITEFLEGK